MRKLYLLSVMLCLGFSTMAQDEVQEIKPTKQVRKKFFNISYICDKIKPTDKDFSLSDSFDEIGSIANNKHSGFKNKWGVSLTRGRSYMLHKKPIARLINIGIDASFFDLSYSNYKIAPGLLGARINGTEESLADDRNEGGGNC